jgi:cation/acetate symporter
MNHEASSLAITVFLFFVAFVLGLSWWLGRKAKSAKGYFAAHGQVGWFVNGVAFAGDYLSAASFLGICGMIAFSGYDGFLYSIGFLAGWIVALFVIAEPIKKLGKFTFADALDSRFHSRGIKLAAAISTLVVSIFYLIPQMVGAGTLIKPLLGLSYSTGVIVVGLTVTFIVTTAGMVSTTWVQYIKGALLVLFCLILTGMILNRGLATTPRAVAMQEQTVQKKDGKVLVNGREQFKGTKEKNFEDKVDLNPVGYVVALPGGVEKTGPLGPFAYLAAMQDSTIVTFSKMATNDVSGAKMDLYKPREVSGNALMVPGGGPFKAVKKEKGQPGWLAGRLDFISLMIALFCGTASLPHILIRYYTVKDSASARKSTVVGIGSIGIFYVLTLFIGLGAMTSGALDVTNNNMSAPLLARSFGEWMFAIISAIAFTTVLGTVSGLILAASGAVAHDLMGSVLKIKMDEHQQVRAAKIAAVVVSCIAMFLGIQFEKMNVSFLVGWAFNIAASANLPALTMLLFWKRTTKLGISASIVVGLVSSLGWLAFTAPAYEFVYGLKPADAPLQISQPGLFTIPLAYLTLIVVSLFTKRTGATD